MTYVNKDKKLPPESNDTLLLVLIFAIVIYVAYQARSIDTHKQLIPDEKVTKHETTIFFTR